MIQARKISGFTTAGIFIAIISLVTCMSVLNASYSSSGVGTPIKLVSSYEIKNPSSVYLSNENMNIIMKPDISGNSLLYGINLINVGDYSQFTFELENNGNVALKVKKVKIEYPVEYQEYVSITVDGISENDTIQPGSTFSNIKVKTEYKNGLYSEDVISEILLDRINIVVDFYE